MLSKIASTLFIAVIGPFLLWILVQKFSDKPILKFNLSESISTTIVGNNNEFIQELYIKNVGKDEAKKINIKIPNVDAKFEIKKNSESDIYLVDKPEKGSEIHYDSLPPSGEIKILIRSRNSINKSEIKITHSKGLAVEAFSENNLLSMVGNIVYSVFMLGLFAFSCYGLYSHLQTFISYDKEEELLSSKKPLFITDKKWNKTRTESIANLFDRSIRSKEDVKSSFPYRFLNDKSNANIPDIEIDSFINKCCDKIKTYFSDLSSRAYTLKSLAQLFTIPKPTDMPDDKWDEIQRHLSELYVSKYLGDLYLSDRQIIPSDSLKRPEFIPKMIWDKIILDVTSIVTGNIISDILQSKFVNGVLISDSSKLSGLPDRNTKLVSRLTMTFMVFRNVFQYTKDDARRMIEELKNNDSFMHDKAESDSLIKFCDHVIRVWEMDSTITSREACVQKKEADMAYQQDAFDASKKTVLKQLEIIDSILSRDNNFLDKIEGYDMPFSPGNEANLRTVASLLKNKS
jgi:hypothetical protein